MKTRDRKARPRRTLTVLLSTLGLVVASLTPGTVAAAEEVVVPVEAKDKFHPTLRTTMATTSGDEQVEALVVIDQRPDVTASPEAEVAGALRQVAEQTQQPVVAHIEDLGGQVLNSFWLQNMLLVSATPAALEEISGAAAVGRVIPNLHVELSRPEESVEVAGGGDATWGVERIRADEVHRDLGITGDGVRIAVLDTGADIDHPDLSGRMATDDPSDPTHPGGWMEFDSNGALVSSTPHDSSNHGTHVAGTALGGDASGVQIGVAPDADLMAGLVIPFGSGTFAQVIAGMQWAMAPTDAAGNPAGAPADVINLSLGGCGLVPEMIEPTRNLHAAGIFPAFSIGNDGFGCPSCGPYDSASPGNVYDAVGVGATDVDDNVATLSCGGVLERADWPDPPADWPERYVKPDLTAPGVDVLSALPGGGYGTLSGTSMAAPHVAGAAALLRQARADIGVDASLSTLAGTAFFDDRHGADRPNARFGWGRIDAFEAVAEASLREGVTGTVTDASTGRPIAGAAVTRVDNNRTVETGQDGSFELRLPAGSYTFEIAHFGHVLATADVEVVEEKFTTFDVALDPAPQGRITGTVSYGPTGHPVPGTTVRVLDVPVPFSAVTDHRGRYEITGVPVGSYEVIAQSPDRTRSDAVEVTVTSRGPGAAADLALAAVSATERVSLSNTGVQGNGGSQFPSMSGDGRYVAFGSLANNLVDGVTNDQWDIYLHDSVTGLLERVSLAHDGGEADGFSLSPQLSTDGRYIGFNSGASNLIEGGSDVTDAYVRDLHRGVNELISVAHDGGPADGGSGTVSLSADGRFAAFGSDATNLVPGDTNGVHDIFVRDRERGTTERVSLAYDGGEADGQSRDPSISADGRYVAFHSDAGNLVEGGYDGATAVYVHDRHTGEMVQIAGPGEGATRDAHISADGRTVAFSNREATFAMAQLFVYDLDEGEFEPVSVSYDGEGMADFLTNAPRLSADGNLVVFHSGASNLVEGVTNGRDDVYVRDRAAGTTERLTMGMDGEETDDHSALAVISADGRHVTFHSRATNLDEGISNGQPDVFRHDRELDRAQPRFAVGQLELRQDEVRAGQPVTVMARIANIGELAGDYEAVLRVNGQAVDTATVRVHPGHSSWVRFQIRPDGPGTYHVAIGAMTGEFQVN